MSSTQAQTLEALQAVQDGNAEDLLAVLNAVASTAVTTGQIYAQSRPELGGENVTLSLPSLRGLFPPPHSSSGNLVHFACGLREDEKAIQVLNVLVAFDTDPVDARDGEGMTALHYACSEGLAKCVRLLLERSENTKDGKPSGEEESDEPCLCLRRDVMGETAAHAAALAGHAECLELLFEHAKRQEEGTGHDPKQVLNVANDSGNTPLMHAVLNNAEAVVFWLLTHGADASVKTKSGDTAESLAAKHGRTDVLALFDQQRLHEKALRTIDDLKV
jgi:26S proteasome non-ATPase regulatory subunit 10